MAQKEKLAKTSVKTRIHLNTYNSIEGAVLILANSYDWCLTKENIREERRNIVRTIAKEREKERVLVFLENGQQILGRSLF